MKKFMNYQILLELGDGLENVLGAEAEDILEDNFVYSKKLEDDALENIKEEDGFEEIKDVFCPLTT